MLCYVDLHSCILVSQFRFEINKFSLNPIQEDNIIFVKGFSSCVSHILICYYFNKVNLNENKPCWCVALFCSSVIGNPF